MLVDDLHRRRDDVHLVLQREVILGRIDWRCRDIPAPTVFVRTEQPATVLLRGAEQITGNLHLDPGLIPASLDHWRNVNRPGIDVLLRSHSQHAHVELDLLRGSPLDQAIEFLAYKFFF